ncbi:MAG: TfoX/Sxy family protein [Flavobacterium sp.]
MAYDDFTLHRIRDFFLEKNADFFEKKMFGGICFMVDNKMCCASSIDKTTGEDRLMCRVGEEIFETVLEKNYVTPMDFTGKSMKGFIYVAEDGFKTKKDLEYWLQLCLDYNPKAKAGRK